ncbi:protein containing Nucleotidyltransferase domain [sediment metagenome]|uniref:Protein containing Nucleotidyltransferase domain n=1 Tax=sediment metagenome TaxID=749907 RepID=D9PJA3_9ZZZZ
MKRMNIEEISERLKPLFKKKHVEKAIVFGSGARGTQTRKSDLDLLIVLATDKRFFDRYEDFAEIPDLIKGSSVDMLIYSPEELKNISHRKFIKMILAEGKIIYEH